MDKVFISHSSEDKYFVNLLVSLLEFHYIDTWCSLTKLQPGTKFPNEIENALFDSDTLIVVISKNVSTSKWITKEVAFFQAKKPKAKIVPLFLDFTNPDDVIPGLKVYQGVNFMKCMLTAFEKLLSLFDKEFLPPRERRESKDRRDEVDRRLHKERRSSSLIQRMRLGFWKSYSSSSGLGKFDRIWMEVREKFKTMQYLKTPASKYIYLNEEGKECDVDEVLEKSTNVVWEELRDKDEESIKAVYVIEAIAEEIKRQYVVRTIDRRNKTDRRSEDDRRRRNTSDY